MAQQYHQSSSSHSFVDLPLDCINTILDCCKMATLGQFSIINHHFRQHTQSWIKQTTNVFVWLRFSVKGSVKLPRDVYKFFLTLYNNATNGVVSEENIQYLDEALYTSIGKVNILAYDRVPTSCLLPNFPTVASLLPALNTLHQELLDWIKDNNHCQYSHAFEQAVVVNNSSFFRFTAPKICLSALTICNQPFPCQNLKYTISISFATPPERVYLAFCMYNVELALFDYLLQHPKEFLERFKRVASYQGIGVSFTHDNLEQSIHLRT